MDRWKQTYKDLGTLKVGQKTKFSFQSVGSVEVSRVIPSCGCFTASFNSVTKSIDVVYKPNPIPVQLKLEGKYNSTKTIKIIHTDNKIEILTFIAKIIKK